MMILKGLIAWGYFFLIFFLSVSTSFAEKHHTKIAIIKADDVRKVHANWNRFFKISQELGVKVSAGIICDSLQRTNHEYFKWLNDWQATGMVEFWNHGWDHKRWGGDQKNQTKEFAGSGYEHQKQHFEDAQTLMGRVLGRMPVAFGAPYNAMDSDTARVLRKTRIFWPSSLTRIRDLVEKSPCS